jgi:predicted DNA-binding transcriptional regulator AlpA
VTSRLVTDSARVWSLRGNWGSVSLTDNYNNKHLQVFVEEGHFPQSVEHSDAVGILEEALLELAWELSPQDAPKYSEWELLASLFDGVDPWSLSASDIYDKINRGELDKLPRPD